MIQFIFVSFILAPFAINTQATQVLRPRGVSLQKKVFYDLHQDFNCLDGSTSIPFIWVNDDYCDCHDGSDEPGTSACPNGLFHCSNLGYTSLDIPSSRVNDGICDCCDGSDDYNSTANCQDFCQDLGRIAYEETKRMEEMYYEGDKIRREMVLRGKQQIEDNNKRLSDLRRELESIESVKNEKEALKKEAEAREKAALDKYRQEQDAKNRAVEEAEILRAQQEEKQNAISAFKELDLNQDGILSFEELKTVAKFDQNNDDVVDDDEAKFFLHMKESMDLEEFISTGWIIMKPYYLQEMEPNKKPGFGIPHVTPIIPQGEAPPQEDVEETPVEDTEHDVDEEDEGPPYAVPKEEEKIQEPPSSPNYDQETLDIIENTKKLRQEYSEIESKYLDITNNIREVEVFLENDYGIEGEFLPLNGQCFELEDREYIYKLCPFNQATQKSKDTGTETNLGQWGRWIGDESFRYNKMRYEGGVTCWNGPARSAEVNLKCGQHDALVSVSEPARCEYKFEFQTPALCRVDQLSNPTHQHTEL